MREGFAIHLRQVAKRILPLYWLVGFIRYIDYRIKLRAENAMYSAGHDSAVPPPALRFRVHGAMHEQVYLQAGQVIAECIDQAWRRCKQSGPDDVLDFGCGPGRVAIQFKELEPACRLRGTDIDMEAVSWAKANLAEVATFDVNDLAPPLAYPDDSYDLIYTVSVFTHLDEDSQFRWLAELGRILRPEGLLIATVHGAHARSSCTALELRSLDSKGFVYRIDRKGRFKLDGLPDTYQTTFHSRAYVERNWKRDFDLLEYVEGGLGGHQDLVILAKRKV